MEHIVNNPALDHIDVAVLCWASDNSPFKYSQLLVRFPGLLDLDYDMAGLRSLTEQFYLHKEIDPEGLAHYSYIPPPEDAGVPPLFKEFCHNYAAAGGKVQSAPFCWGRMKKHKGYKSFIKLLGPALDAQIADRDRRKQQGKFVAEWRNLTTWINQRGWEDLVSDDTVQSGPESKEMLQYRGWILTNYGPTAKAPLSEAQYLAYATSSGAFTGMKALLSKQERLYLFAAGHRSFLAGMTGEKSCYEYLVELYKAKI